MKKENFDEIVELRKEISSLRGEISGHSQSKLDEKLIREQIKTIRSQQRRERAEKGVKIFRKTVETLASKPISPKESYEMLFGTGKLKGMFGKKR